jgi:hypothetical protein
MKQKLTITSNWREGGPPPGGGGGMLYPGDYRVPEDVPADVAERIVAAGAGTLSTVDEPAAVDDAANKRGRGKKPAIEDKDLGRAPENKSALDG